MSRIPYAPSEIEFVERKSRFIGNIFCVSSEAEARAAIRDVETLHDRANHVVYAYDIAAENASRFFDAGEPKGTAGLPVYEIFRRENLTNYCCTVTRYFGGILLGAGGLIRAYANTARLALEAAGIAEETPYIAFSLTCDYPHYDIIRAHLRGVEHTAGNADFGERITLGMTVPQEIYEELLHDLAEITAGMSNAGDVRVVMKPRRIK